MNKPLDKGDYCVPRDAEERKLVMLIARMLGVAHHGAGNGSNEELKAIWRSVYGDYPISDCIDTLWDRKPLSVPDFIAGMYALAESRKATDEGSVKMKMNKGGVFKWNGKEWVDVYAEKWDKLHSLEAKSALLDDILKRLTALEGCSFEQLCHKYGEADSAWVIDTRFSGAVRACMSDAMGAIQDRLTKLEERDDPKEIQRLMGSYNGGFMAEMQARATAGNGYLVSIDPKASPKNIPFEVALMYMKAGRIAKRAAWNGSIAAIDGYPDGTLKLKDILATDWEVVPETK